MKIKFFALLAFALLLASCGGAPAAKTAASNSDAKPIELTAAQFADTVFDYRNATLWNYIGSKPAIVDFYATWCGPCKQMAPVLDQILNQYLGKIEVYKVDVDKAPELAQYFGINSIPRLLFIPMNGEPQMIAGAMDKAAIETHIKDILKVE